VSCDEYIDERRILFIFSLKKKRADRQKQLHSSHQQKKREFVEEILRRMLVVLKPIKCELEIAKGVRAKGEASVTERDVVFNTTNILLKISSTNSLFFC
jgi:hypothetical protein